MAMNIKMSMKLSQSLRMTPQLQQAIKLLQLSRMELETEIRKELIENPVLEEVAETTDNDPAQNSDDKMAPAEDRAQDQQDPTKQDEFEWENFVENQYKPPQQFTGGGNEELFNYENIISTEQTLTEHLLWQVGLSGFNDEEEMVLQVLINYLEDDGYLKIPLSEIAENENLEEKELEEMLPFLQELDPAGVGARTLKECLLIQAKVLDEDTYDLVNIIENHLSDLEKKNYKAISKALEFPVEDVIELCKIIFSMDPKPGRAFMTNDAQYVMPDVYVYKLADEYVVSLNEDGLPKLRISNLYKTLMQDKQQQKVKEEQGTAEAGGSDAKNYIQDKMKSAIWLIKSIHQRQRTIYKVTESIVKHQTEFFEKGPSFIKPMILRDIANDIGMHESTVSRVTTSKYVHTPQGIFELKYFFNSGINKTDGDTLASESVKMKIKKLVTDEDTKKPLSDQKIVELLKKDGIKIARRTVAKYRDMLKILPSSKRKKYY